METHSKAGFFQAGYVKRFGTGGTTAVAGALVLLLALGASGCNCDSATGPSGNQTTGGNFGSSSNTIIKGKVVRPDGSPVVGASVAMPTSAFPTYTQKTDDEGEYWSDLPGAATVTVKVTASGFADASRSVTAVSGHSVRADFTLQPQ
jgi:hypothetical protein